MQQTYSHTYLYGGTYQITLSAGAHKTHATVVVYGPGGPAPTPTPAPSTSAPSTATQTFNAAPTSGAAPLTVTFSGIVTGASQGWCASGCSSTLVFGDGATGSVPLPTSQSGSQAYTIQHTYTLGGTYTATLYQGQSGAGKATVGNPRVITVAGNTQLPPFSLTPNVSGNPLAVSMQFEYTLCQGYAVDWGDTTTDTGQSACGSSATATKTLAHTYTSAGSYTIKLTRSSQIDTASIVIQN
jgi:PKD repeat protein